MHGTQNLLLLHGWSGSGRYYSPAVHALLEDENLLRKSKVKKIYVMDLRGHGRSVCEVIPDRENFPDMMVRLAVDLQEFLVSLDEKSEAPRMCVVGSSMGAAILWNYFDMFSYRNYPFITSAVFVDQAPLQYEKEDWQLGSKGMRNPSDLTNLQHLLKSDMKEFAAGNAKCCLVSPGTLDQEYIEQITEETLRCDPHFLGELMADHTRLDWRPLLERKWPPAVPVLNLAGGKSDIFPVDGVREINRLLGDRVYNRLEVFEDCSHWLYIERPNKFMHSVVNFIDMHNCMELEKL
mmetsp:Transcript_1521/g.2528  ORF Transcript_1521/g.2528 Transcript_1521/m.2528 type:complete len:293 (-) Transcript_1521:641-1519(-)